MSIWAETKAELDESEAEDKRARGLLQSEWPIEEATAAAQVHATLSVAAALRALVRTVDEKVSPL